MIPKSVKCIHSATKLNTYKNPNLSPQPGIPKHSNLNKTATLKPKSKTLQPLAPEERGVQGPFNSLVCNHEGPYTLLYGIRFPKP